jgi:hypothetical protein
MDHTTAGATRMPDVVVERTEVLVSFALALIQGIRIGFLTDSSG